MTSQYTTETRTSEEHEARLYNLNTRQREHPDLFRAQQEANKVPDVPCWS